MRPRFSLRWLLIFTALAAVFCYSWIARPTILAKRYAAESKNFSPGDYAIVLPRSWLDLLRGRRRLEVRTMVPSPYNLAGSYDYGPYPRIENPRDPRYRKIDVNVFATPWTIHPVPEGVPLRFLPITD
jgi:hypothetical protein